jgi:DNA polymerase-1
VNDKGDYEPCSEGDPKHVKYAIEWKIRDAFQEFEKDWWMIVGDYGQMELRMTAVLANEKAMIAGFEAGEDIHYYNATIVTGKKIEDVTKAERRDAKAVSFGLVYGKTERGFAIDWFEHEPDFWDERPNPSNEFGQINRKYLKKTQQIIRRFFDGFPEIEREIAATHKTLEKYGYVRTITGRKRRIPEIFSTSNGIRNRAKRQSFNARVQGSSADYIKMAMIKMEREYYIYQTPGGVYDKGMLAQVHDELVSSAPEEKAREMFPRTKELMETVIELPCPITADLELGYKYGSCK